MGEHGRRHQRRRGGDRRTATRTDRHRDRHLDLPARHLHRTRHRQPHPCPADRLPAGDLDHRSVPVRMAHRIDQRGGDPDLPGHRRAGAVLVRRRGEHDDPRRAGRRGRRGGGRRDHRRGEHPAPTTAEPARRFPDIDGTGDPEGLARGPRRDSLRDDHHPRRGGAGVLHRRAFRLLLPSVDHRLRARGGRLAGRRAHRHTRAVPDPAAERARRAPAVAGHQDAAAGIHGRCWPRPSAEASRPMSRSA